MAKRTEEEWSRWQFQYENKGSNSLQAYVIKRLKERDDILAVKVTKANTVGVSDLIICANGRFVAIELKVGDNTPTANQERFLADAARAGAVAGVAHTWGEVKHILRRAGLDI